jgi:hypothetical protein
MAAMDRQPVGRWPQRSAQRAADGQLISLGRGEAAGYRARMRGGERYLCPACEVAFLTARGGSRTDHFVGSSSPSVESSLAVLRSGESATR